MIKADLDAVVARLVEVCVRTGRCAGDVTLVGVTKFAAVPAINAALAAGLVHIAENRVQSAQEKFPLLSMSAQPVVKHLIGHLQTNKAKDAVLLFDLIQSVDSIRLVEEIDRRAAAIGKVQDILVQVDIAREAQKFGLPEEDLDAFLTHAETLAHVRVRGLMTMGPLTEDRSAVRQVFARLRAHFLRIRAERSDLKRTVMEHLSMGMSNDFEIAIEEGATMVRIGSLIFK